MTNVKVYTLLVLCVLFWSGNFVLGRYVAEDIEAMEMVFFRWSFSLIIISPILIRDFSKILKIVKNNLLIMLTLSFLGIALFNTLVYTALNYTSATNALIINSSIPLLILFLSFILLKQHISQRQILGIILSTIGVLYLILEGRPLKILSLEFNTGDLWVVAASFTWALYSMLVKFKPKEFDTLDFFSALVFMGFIMIFPFYLYQGYSIEQEITLVKENYMVFIYISLFTSVLSFHFWNTGIAQIGASKTGQFTHLMPVFGAILAYVFLGEVLKSYHVVGMLLIAIGIYLSLKSKKILV